MAGRLASPAPPIHPQPIPTPSLIMVSSNTGPVGPGLNLLCSRGCREEDNHDREQTEKKLQWNHGNKTQNLLPVPWEREKRRERKKDPGWRGL